MLTTSYAIYVTLVAIIADPEEGIDVENIVKEFVYEQYRNIVVLCGYRRLLKLCSEHAWVLTHMGPVLAEETKSEHTDTHTYLEYLLVLQNKLQNIT